MNSVKLWPADIHPSEFGENFDPSTLVYENEDEKRIRESVLKVLRKVVLLSNENLIRNADCLISNKKPHNDPDILWVVKKRKRVPEKLSLSY